jgi:hypothetical protein
LYQQYALPAPAQPASATWFDISIRLVLCLGHIAILAVLLAMTPPEFAFHLGKSSGPILIFGTVFLWSLVWFVRSPLALGSFAALVLLQAGAVGIHVKQFRAESTLLTEIAKETIDLSRQVETKLASYRLNEVFAMLRPGNSFSTSELEPMRQRAREARRALEAFYTGHDNLIQNQALKIEKISRTTADDFRKGVESERTTVGKARQLELHYCQRIADLLTLLIDRRGTYRMGPKQLLFESAGDVESYNNILDDLIATEKQLGEVRQKRERSLAFLGKIATRHL